MHLKPTLVTVFLLLGITPYAQNVLRLAPGQAIVLPGHHYVFDTLVAGPGARIRLTAPTVDLRFHHVAVTGNVTLDGSGVPGPAGRPGAHGADGTATRPASDGDFGNPGEPGGAGASLTLVIGSHQLAGHLLINLDGGRGGDGGAGGHGGRTRIVCDAANRGTDGAESGAGGRGGAAGQLKVFAPPGSDRIQASQRTGQRGAGGADGRPGGFFPTTCSQSPIVAVGKLRYRLPVERPEPLPAPPINNRTSAPLPQPVDTDVHGMGSPGPTTAPPNNYRTSAPLPQPVGADADGMGSPGPTGNPPDRAPVGEFPRTPPAPSALVANLQLPLPPGLTLGKVYGRLLTALEGAGYGQPSVQRWRDGFALITNVEQILEDGNPLRGDDRWAAQVRYGTTFSITNFLQSLLYAQRGYFRVVVFVVGSPGDRLTSARSVSRQEAVSWHSVTAGGLPGDLEAKPFTLSHQISVLIYEFIKEENGSQPVFSPPVRLPGVTHLRRAHLLARLGAE